MPSSCAGAALGWCAEWCEGFCAGFGEIFIFMFMPTASKPYVRFATFLMIALCLGVGVGWGGWWWGINVMCRVRGTRSCLTSLA